MSVTEKSHEDIRSSSPLESKIEKRQHIDESGDVQGHRAIASDKLARKLSARQVSMIAIGGTIGKKPYRKL